MVLTTAQKRLVQGVMDSIAERTGLINTKYRWPNNVVPVRLTDGHFDAAQEAHVYQALRTLESVSCVRFVNYTSEPNFVQMTVIFDIVLSLNIA